jgi:phosphohistidine phosphatase SixA
MFEWWTKGGREERVVEAIFRIAVAGCFIGHGAFGVMGKEAWLPYFAVVGIPESWAWRLMPVVGALDILVGIAALVSPRPAILAYAAGWAVWTALLRPLAGESVFETLERAGNYGLPIAFLVAAGFRARGAGFASWVQPVRIGRMSAPTRRRAEWVLRATAGLLLVGHGGLAVGGKPLLAEHMGMVGVGVDLLPVMGWGEILLGLLIAVRPVPALLVVALLWKVGTEALHPMAGAPFWEFVERAGSYAAPLTLLALSPVVAERLAHLPARRAGVTAATVLLLALGAAGLDAVPVRAQTPVLERLRDGGLVLACRHAITDRSRGDSRRVDYDDPATQRVLSEEGRSQARRLGRVLEQLGVPIGEVLTSPFARTRESAELAFGRSTVNDALVHGNRPEQRRERVRLLGARPADGNRVLMTHQGILYGSLPAVERGSIREGDCVVVQPLGDGGYDVLGRFGPEELAALASTLFLHFALSSPGAEAR